MARGKDRVKAWRKSAPPPPPVPGTRSEPKRELAHTNPAGKPGRQSRWFAASAHKLIPGLLIAAPLAVYHSSFTGPFIWDDLDSISGNPYIRALWPLTNVMSWPRNSTVAARPVAAFSLAINYALGGLEVWGYHAFNLTVHVLAGLLLFGIVRRTLGSPRFGEAHQRRAPWLAMVVALIWLVHPLNTEGVTYVIQRTELLFGLFLLLTLYCVIRGSSSSQPGPWYLASVAACALGMGSKEVMVGAPLIVVLYDGWFLSGSFREGFRRRWGLYVGLAGTWLILAGLGATAVHSASAGFHLSVTPWQYARTQFGVIVHYLRLALWPHPLALDYYDWPVANTVSTIVPPAVVVLTLVAATVWAARHQPGLAFLGAWFFIVLAPTSSILPLVGEFAAERRMYVPLAAVITLIVIGGDAGLRYLLGRSEAGDILRRGLTAGVVVAVAATLGYVTMRRNEDYRSVLSVWSDAVAKRPDNARAQNNLGTAFNLLGRVAEARGHYSEAVRIKPNYYDARTNLAFLLTRQGELDEAIAHLSEAVKIRPSSASAHKQLGVALARKGRFEEAIAHYSEALRVMPGDAELYSNLARALHREGRLEDAIAYYDESLQIRPNHAWTHYNLGEALVQAGRFDEAARHFESAMRLEPNHSGARRALADLRSGITTR